MSTEPLTTERVRELFIPCPDCGALHWAVDHGDNRAGDAAGVWNRDGRWVVIDGKRHRYALVRWLIEVGPIPDGHALVFVDGNPLHDEMENLIALDPHNPGEAKQLAEYRALRERDPRTLADGEPVDDIATLFRGAIH
jgi:hypothetical protein